MRTSPIVSPAGRRQKPPRAGAGASATSGRFGRPALAWTISVALLGAAIAIIGDAERTEALAGDRALTGVLAIWSIWPLSYSAQQAIGRRPREST